MVSDFLDAPEGGAVRELDRLTRLATWIGVLAVLVSLLVGVLAYRGSRSAIVEGTLRTNLVAAHSLGANLDPDSKERALATIRARWESERIRYPRSYYCIIGSNGALVEHALLPEMVGHDVSGVMLPNADGSTRTVREMLEARGDWVGQNTNARGLEQIVSYAFSEELDGAIAVHVPMKTIDEEVAASARPWLIGLGLVCFVLLPLSLTFLRRVSSSSKRALIAGEKERKRLSLELTKAQKMDAVGRLASTVTHDFNNILTVIGGHSELIALEPVSPDVRGNAEAIRGAYEHATLLIQQLASISRSQPSQPKVMDAGDVVQGLSKTLQCLISEGVDFQVACTRGAFIMGDPVQVEQIVLNLILNALAALQGDGALSLETSIVENFELRRVVEGTLDKGVFVRISITDTGAGIAGDVQEKIFEPFFTTKGEQGTGLGLSTVYKIVRELGGSVEVESQLGKGSTFSVFFPLASPPGPRPSKASANVRSGGGESILLVEDDAAILDMASGALRQAGYQVQCATDGIEARSVATKGGAQFDLLVTDIVMPHSNGLELADWFKKQHRGAGIILTTGYSERSVDLPEADLVAMLRKPFTPSDLLHAVAEVLDKKYGVRPDLSCN